jgi:uncharacterized protein
VRVSLFLNHACNCDCSYCYGGDKFDRAMPDDVARAGVEMAFSGGAHGGPAQVSFFGGEPLMEMARIRSIVDYAERRADELDREVRFLVITNGSLLRGETLDWLLEKRFTIAMSLDGCRGAHESGRPFVGGRSSYADVTANLATLLKRARVGVKVIAVLHPDNVDLAGESLTALLDLGVRNISMNLDYSADWTDDARGRAGVALRGLGDAYVAAWRARRHFSLNLFDRKIATHLDGGFAQSDRCDFGCEEVAVSPQGRLYPCDRLVAEDVRDDVVIGDVFGGIDVARRDALIASKNDVLDDCRECALAPRCMHWCGCVNHALTGEVGGVDGLLCWFEQRIVDEADRCAGLLFDEENPGFLARFYAPRLRVLRS